MSRPRFTRNPAFEEEMSRDPAFRRAMAAEARAVQRQVKAIAPRGPTGNYRDSIVATKDAVGTTDFAGHIVEFGSVNSPVYAPLRRGVRAAGLRLDESPKS